MPALVLCLTLFGVLLRSTGSACAHSARSSCKESAGSWPQVRLASVRRSLFTNETERAKFLNHLAGGTLELLRTQQGLADHANYHEFCRLLGRLKTNYQLSELVRWGLLQPYSRV